MSACPWCSSQAAPVPTDPAQANWQYHNANDPMGVKRNPAMCPECFGVGAWDDWGAV